MFEKLIFNLLAFSLFIIVFFKIIRKNDTNYMSILCLQALGIAISFIEIKKGIIENIPVEVLRYCLSVFIPVIVLILEYNGINFSEIFSIGIAKLCMLFGNTKVAKSILVKLVTKYPDSYTGHKLLAESYEKEGGMRRAIDEYVTSVDLRKNDYKSYFKITKLLKELGKKDEAIQMLDNLLKTKPDCYDASILLGELLCEQEKFKEAANVYHEALKYNPSDFDLYYNLGIVYTRLSDFQMAKEMYERAAAINHRMYAVNYNLGLIVFIQKDYDLAERYFLKAMDGDYEAEAYYALAKIYIKKNIKDKAILFLNKAIEINPKLLNKAANDIAFENIKQYITVSVKMNEDNEIKEEKLDDSRSDVIIKLEKDAINYLEDTTKLVEGMSIGDSRQRLDEKIENIINKDKNKDDILKNNYEDRQKN